MARMKKSFFFLVLGIFCLASCQSVSREPVSDNTGTPQASSTVIPSQTPVPISPYQGWAPSQLGLSISPDGKEAYVPFELDDALLVVDLDSLQTIDTIDLSPAGQMLTSSATALTPDGKWLYLSNFATGNVIVVDTQAREVKEVLPLKPVHAMSIAISGDGRQVYIPCREGGLYVVNTADNSYHLFQIEGYRFGPVGVARDDPDRIYTMGTTIDANGEQTPIFFMFNLAANQIEKSMLVPENIMPKNGWARRVMVDAQGTHAYFGYRSGFTDRGDGNFTIFDLDAFQVISVSPVENGVSDFTIDESTGRGYILGFWSGGSAPNQLPIHEWDLATNQKVRDIQVSPSSDQRAVQLGPAGSSVLYMTESDFNLLRKIDLQSGKEIGVVRFNKEEIRPYSLLKNGAQGIIICPTTQKIFLIDLNNGQVQKSYTLPFTFFGWGFHDGRLFLGKGKEIVAIDPQNGNILERFPLAEELKGIGLTFYNDKMAVIEYSDAMNGAKLTLFDAETFALIKSIPLTHEPYGDKVIVSPDGKKLYIACGLTMGGPTTITILDADTLDILNTIALPAEDQRNGGTGFVQGVFDDKNRILYLNGFTSIYKINMENDSLIGTLDLIDLYFSNGFYGWSPTGLAGLEFSEDQSKLYAASGDAHSIYIYDITQSTWEQKIINVQGYFITDAVISPNGQFLFTVNNRSDSITMVNLELEKVEIVINLQ